MNRAFLSIRQIEKLSNLSDSKPAKKFGEIRVGSDQFEPTPLIDTNRS